MHSNPAFRRVSRDRNLRFAAQRGFGVLAIDGAGPLVSHIPFVLTEDGAAVHAHLVRSNPIARHLRAEERAAVLAVSGPDSYISPDWYGTGATDQVPTWNYVAVHIRGTLRRRADETLRAHLDSLSARFESELRTQASVDAIEGVARPAWQADALDHAGRALRGERGRHLEAQSEQGRERSPAGRTACRERTATGKRPLHLPS